MKNRNSFLYFDSRSWTTTKVASLSFFLFFFFFRSKKEIDHHLLKMNRGREVKIGGHDRYSINLSRSRAILPRETLIKPRSTDVITVFARGKKSLINGTPPLPAPPVDQKKGYIISLSFSLSRRQVKATDFFTTTSFFFRLFPPWQKETKRRKKNQSRNEKFWRKSRNESETRK